MEATLDKGKKEKHDEQVQFASHKQFCDGCPVSTNPRSNTFRGANRLSNNVAEAHGAVMAIEIAISLQLPAVKICYDSEYARRTITGEWKGRLNARLIACGTLSYRRLLASCAVTWEHIDSHTGDVLNELADSLAEQGATGISRLPDFWQGPRSDAMDNPFRHEGRFT